MIKKMNNFDIIFMIVIKMIIKEPTNKKWKSMNMKKMNIR